MRLSPQRHTLAVLRTQAGMTQKEMAELAECSRPTVQAIELGKLRLSEKLGQLIAHKTGIDLAWLLRDDVTQAPIDRHGTPYTNELFEDYQAIAHAQKHHALGSLQALHSITSSVRRVAGITLRAFKTDESALAAYKLAKALDELEEQFGVTDAERDAVEMNEVIDEAAGKAKDDTDKFSNYMLNGYFAAMRREMAKKKKHEKVRITLGGEYTWLPDGRILYKPERFRDPEAASVSKRKKK